MIRAKVKDSDLTNLLKRTKPELYRLPMLNLVKEGTDLLQDETRKRAPGKTGATLGTVTPYIFARQNPLGRIRVTTKQGVILNRGGLHKTQRYRTSGRVGKKLRGWFSGATRIKAVKQGVARLMQEAAQQIESRWKF